MAGSVSPRRAIVQWNLDAIRDRSGFRAARSRSEASPTARPAGVFASYGRYWGEFLVLSARPEWFDRRLRRIEGEEILQEAARRGPVCALTGHLGNWDLCARFTRRLLPRMAVVAERLEPPSLYRLFGETRERDGGRVIPADRAGRRLFRLWGEGGHAGLVADRVFGSGRRTVPFLGGRRELPSSGVDLALRAGATMVPVFLVREGGGYVLRVHPPLAIDEDPLRGFGRSLEQEIARHPEQWCLLSPACDDGVGAARNRADRSVPAREACA